MLPDTGERYLSTPLFANISADMTEEELEDLALDAGRAARFLSAASGRGRFHAGGLLSKP